MPTTSSAQIRLHSHSGGGKYVMLLCKQQWGEGKTTSDTYFTFSFPVSFSSATSYQVTTGGISAGDTQYGIGVHTKTATSCRIYLNSAVANVIVIGYQQWGVYSQGGVRSATVTLPIAFPNAAYNVSCTGKITAYEANTPGTNEISTTAFKYYCGTGNGGCWYIAFGK